MRRKRPHARLGVLSLAMIVSVYHIGGDLLKVRHGQTTSGRNHESEDHACNCGMNSGAQMIPHRTQDRVDAEHLWREAERLTGIEFRI